MHDGHPLSKGQLPEWFDVGEGELASGNTLDTSIHDQNMKTRAEEQAVLDMLEKGEIDREESETLLDMLASNQDL